MKEIIKYGLIGVIIVAVFFTGGTFLAKALVTSEQPADREENPEEERMPDQDGKRTNILVLGADARPGEATSRSDVMILASIDPELDKIVLVSIPRDTRVNINANHVDKMGSANFYGGPKLAVKIVEELMNLHIDHYVEMNFNGFKEIVDAVDGVTVDVPQRMYKPSEGIDLQPGVQTLYGKDALGYVRYRDYAQGDIERVQVQQSFLKDLAAKVLSPSSIVKIPSFVQIAYKNVDTDMGLRDMLRIAAWAPSFKTDSIITQTLPGYFYDERDRYGNLTASFWLADKTIAASLLNTLFSGAQVATLVQQETVTKQVGGGSDSTPKETQKEQPAEPVPEKSEAPKSETPEKSETSEESKGSEEPETPEKSEASEEPETPETATESDPKIPEEPEFTLNTDDVSGIPAASGVSDEPISNPPEAPDLPPVENPSPEDTVESAPVISPEELEWQSERAKTDE